MKSFYQAWSYTNQALQITLLAYRYFVDMALPGLSICFSQQIFYEKYSIEMTLKSNWGQIAFILAIEFIRSGTKSY